MTPMTEDNYDTIDMASVADSALEDIQPGMIVKEDCNCRFRLCLC